jgi:hypothetical protein
METTAVTEFLVEVYPFAMKEMADRNDQRGMRKLASATERLISKKDPEHKNVQEGKGKT